MVEDAKSRIELDPDDPPRIDLPGDKVKTTALLREVIRCAKLGRPGAAEQERAMRYYEGDIFSPEMLAYLKEHELPTSHVPNLLAKHINSVLGAEAQRQVDWQIIADDDFSVDVADALNQRVNETMRLHDATHHCSEAYKSMAVKGLGYLRVAPSTDPLGLPLEITALSTADVIDDPSSRRSDDLDCRWRAHRKFMWVDEAVALFPEHEALIRDIANRLGRTDNAPFDPLRGGEGFAFESRAYGEGYAEGSTSWYSGVDEAAYITELVQFIDGALQVAVYEVEYRAYEIRDVLHFADGRREVWDPDNTEHRRAIQSPDVGLARDQRVPVMRCAWYIGSHLVKDGPSPYPHNLFSIVRWCGHREERSRAFYGLARLLIPSQNAYGFARIQRDALLDRVTIEAEEGAFDGIEGQTLADVKREAVSTGGIIRWNKGYAVNIRRDWKHIGQLDGMMREAEEEMRAASGISLSFTGEGAEQQSGVAISNLASLSASLLAEIDEGHAMARRMLGRIVLAYEVEKIGSSETEVAVKSSGGKLRKRVVLNRREGPARLTNALARARMQVAIADVRTSEGYRQQNMLMMREMAQQMPENFVPAFAIAMIESSSLPNREELSNWMRQQAGMSQSEEEQAALEQARAEREQEAIELEQAQIRAEIGLKEAQTRKADADARAVIAEVGIKAASEDERTRIARESAEREAANDPEMAEKVKLIEEARRALASRQSPR